MIALHLLDVSLDYVEEGRLTAALRRVDLTVAEQELVCLVGPSGCGKSTIVNLAAGFLEPTSGSVLFRESEVLGAGRERAVVFQDDAVFPWMTVRQNIEYGPRVQGLGNEAAAAVSRDLLAVTGLAQWADAWPRQLSGGMRKRVDIARALATKPDLLLMDEPFGNLDVWTKDALVTYLLSALSLRAISLLFVTHDIEEALRIGDRLVVLSHRPGTIQEDVSVEKILGERPRNKSELRFQELRNRIEGALR